VFSGRNEHRAEDEEEGSRQQTAPWRHVQAEDEDILQANGQTGPTAPATMADAGWDPTQHHGDKMRAKKDQCARIISVQLNTFPTSNTEDDVAKRTILASVLQESGADIMLTQEDNTAWDLVSAERRPKELCRSWFESMNLHSAYNTHAENKERRTHLQGGVSIWSINDATHRVLERGVDQTGLGRWGFVRYQGRNGVTTRVYSVYRPCKSAGPNTVYSQHIRYMAEQNDARCPQVAMVQDLKQQLQEATDVGDQIVVGGDFNLDMCSSVWTQLSDEFSLENAIFHRHGTEGPNTHARGTKQIDGFLVSRTLASNYTTPELLTNIWQG